MSQNLGKRWKIRLAMLLALVGVLVIGVAPVSAAASSFTISSTFPIDLVVFVPCAAGGAGEDVALSGTLHDIYHITFDATGGFHSKVLDNPQGVGGVGLTTGMKYQGTGVTQGELNGKLGFETTSINNFRIIGQGPGNNFLVHGVYHVTVNPNDTLTAYVDNFTAECK